MKQEKLKTWMEKRRYSSYLMGILAGAYLLYTAWDLFRGAPGSSGSPGALYGFAVLFALAGLCLCGLSLLAIRKGWYREHGTENDPGWKKDSKED